MAGFDKDGQDKQAKEKDLEFADTAAIEAEELDEFADADSDDLEVDFKPGKTAGIDSVEIDVEEILSEIAAEVDTGDTANVRIRKQLETMMERKRQQEELVDFDEYDLDG